PQRHRGRALQQGSRRARVAAYDGLPQGGAQMKSLFLLLLAAAPAMAQVTVQEYPVPRGHGIHDLWADAAPNGPVWFSAQGSGSLGILDPKSGKVEFVALGRGSSPHGVIAAEDGAPWLTDGGQNAKIGRAHV